MPTKLQHIQNVLEKLDIEPEYVSADKLHGNNRYVLVGLKAFGDTVSFSELTENIEGIVEYDGTEYLVTLHEIQPDVDAIRMSVVKA